MASQFIAGPDFNFHPNTQKALYEFSEGSPSIDLSFLSTTTLPDPFEEELFELTSDIYDNSVENLRGTEVYSVLGDLHQVGENADNYHYEIITAQIAQAQEEVREEEREDGEEITTSQIAQADGEVNNDYAEEEREEERVERIVGVKRRHPVEVDEMQLCEQLMRYKVKELKALCKHCSLKCTGNKDELVKRLKEFCLPHHSIDFDALLSSPLPTPPPKNSIRPPEDTSTQLPKPSFYFAPDLTYNNEIPVTASVEFCQKGIKCQNWDQSPHLGDYMLLSNKDLRLDISVNVPIDVTISVDLLANGEVGHNLLLMRDYQKKVTENEEYEKQLSFSGSGCFYLRKYKDVRDPGERKLRTKLNNSGSNNSNSNASSSKKLNKNGHPPRGNEIPPPIYRVSLCSNEHFIGDFLIILVSRKYKGGEKSLEKYRKKYILPCEGLFKNNNINIINPPS